MTMELLLQCVHGVFFFETRRYFSTKAGITAIILRKTAAKNIIEIPVLKTFSRGKLQDATGFII